MNTMGGIPPHCNPERGWYNDSASEGRCLRREMYITLQRSHARHARVTSAPSKPRPQGKHGNLMKISIIRWNVRPDSHGQLPSVHCIACVRLIRRLDGINQIMLWAVLLTACPARKADSSSSSQ